MRGFWRVRCDTCITEARKPLVVRENCESCAESTASTHRAQGHDVTITPPEPEKRWERSKSTQQLLGRGW